MDRYTQVYESFEWERAWNAFEGDREWFNISHEIVGKHADSERTALRIFNFEDDGRTETSFSTLADLAGQFATFLDEQGLERGDRVAVMAEPCSELYAAIAGTWMGGYVLVPLYTLFGPEAVNYRLHDSEATAVVTTNDQAEDVDRAGLDALDHVVLVEGGADGVDGVDGVDGAAVSTFDDVRERSPIAEPIRTKPDEAAIIQYTSGTTGEPKGIIKPHLEPIILYPFVTYGIDIRPDEVYFSTASPAWAYGLLVSTVYSLHLGCGLNTFRGRFAPKPMLDVVEDLKVTNLFAAPTAYRKLARLNLSPGDVGDHVRVATSLGEALNAETVEWFESLYGVPILDAYGATESATVLGNYTFDNWEIKPGSLGKPMPGFAVELFELDADEPVPDGETGEIVSRLQGDMNELRNRSHSFLGRPEETAEIFDGDWIRSGDLGRRDEDGYIWFEGRADDVIISAGYRIGPTEVESSLLEHDAVVEAAAVGVPDETRGEVVAAFVVLADDAEPSGQLADKIQADVKRRLSKHEYPRVVEFREELPTTESGKLQRADLREDYER